MFLHNNKKPPDPVVKPLGPDVWCRHGAAVHLSPGSSPSDTMVFVWLLQVKVLLCPGIVYSRVCDATGLDNERENNMFVFTLDF